MRQKRGKSRLWLALGHIWMGEGCLPPPGYASVHNWMGVGIQPIQAAWRPQLCVYYVAGTELRSPWGG